MRALFAYLIILMFTPGAYSSANSQLSVKPNGLKNYGPSTSAMGGTGRASILPTESIHLNPAFVSLVTGYHLSIGYYSDQLELDQSANAYQVAITDATENSAFPAALAATQWNIPNGKFAKYALGLGGRQKSWTWGMSYNYSNIETNDLNQSMSQLDIGTLFNITSRHMLGLVASNVLEIPEDFRQTTGVEKEYALAGSYFFNNHLVVQLDGVYHPDREQDHWRYGFGMQTRLYDFFALRLGTFRDENYPSTFQSAGLAFLGPRLKLNYALSQNANDAQLTSHKVDFTLPF